MNHRLARAETYSSGSIGPAWLRWLGPLPGRREAHALALPALVVGVVLCAASVMLGFHGRTFMGRPLGGDFVEFYTVGQICNHYPAARIYDVRLADELQHATLRAMPASQMLIFGQAPFVAWFFRPFALLPYAWAYMGWLVFSASVYICALALLFRTVQLKTADRKTGFLLALSSTPFLFETWIGGQMSVVALAVWALFFWCMEKDWGFAAGLLLSLCFFKPTLVALPALILIAGRKWRVLGGLASGAGLLGVVSVATVGMDGCRAWFADLALDGKVASQNVDARHLAKNLDLVSFLHLILPGARAAVVSSIAAAVAVAAVGWLGWAWWQKRPASRRCFQSERLLWAATLCLTLVISPYAPIYDAVLLVAAAALVVAEMGAAASAGWLTALYVIPWISSSFAEFLHVQMLTLVAAGFGIWALGVSRKGGERLENTNVRASRHRQEESTMTSNLEPGVTGRFQVRSRGLP